MAIKERNGKWAVIVYDPSYKGKMRWVGTYDTEDKAEEIERLELAKIRPASRARTVSDWIDVWLRDYERPASSTQRTYRLALKRVREDVGSLRINKITRPQARGLARQWPRGTTRVARSLFGDAYRDGLISENPFANMRLEVEKGRKDLDALTEPAILELADAALHLGEYGQEFRALIIFLGFVGCRPGELACIRRADVDVDRAEVTIRFALDGDGGEKAPKNGKPRVVTVPPPALQALRDVPVRLKSPYLFHTARGKRLSKGSLSYAFRMTKAHWGKREKLAMYELRHAAATLLIERGLPPHVVANQLGHTDGGALVQRLYGHPSEKGMREQVRMAFADWHGQAQAVEAANREVS